MEEVACNLCGARDFTVVFGAGVAQRNQVVRCSRCRFMYATPRLETHHDHWPDVADFDYQTHVPLRYQKERVQVRDLAPTRRLLAELHPRHGKCVEVGCSLGFQLAAMRDDGWEVLGIEPDRHACRHATEKLGVPTLCSVYRDGLLADASVDVLIMLHVIEHVPDAMATLRSIHRVLKPGGHLVLETPRYDTLVFRILGRRERNVSLDDHIFFFTVESLRRAYEMAGFSLERLVLPGRSLSAERFLHLAAARLGLQPLRRVADWVSRRSSLRDWTMNINLRDIQRVCLRRVEPAPAPVSHPQRTEQPSV